MMKHKNDAGTIVGWLIVIGLTIAFVGLFIAALFARFASPFCNYVLAVAAGVVGAPVVLIWGLYIMDVEDRIKEKMKQKGWRKA